MRYTRLWLCIIPKFVVYYTQRLHIIHSCCVLYTTTVHYTQLLCIIHTLVEFNTQRTRSKALGDVHLSQPQQDEVDARFSRLHGHGGIGRQDRTVFLKRSTMQTADWQHFLQYCDPYVFEGILDQQLAKSYFQMTGIYRLLLEAVCHTSLTDAEALDRTQELETAIAEALTAFERAWPVALVSGPVIHTLLHYPRFIYRWNAVRNYWCYFNERSVRNTNYIR